MIIQSARKVCSVQTDMPDEDWIFVTTGRGETAADYEFCSWQCLSMFASENFRPAFL